MFSVFVPVPVFVLHHPTIGHLGGDAGVGAHGKEGSPAGGKKGLLAKQLMLLLMVLGGIQKQMTGMHVGRRGKWSGERRGWRRWIESRGVPAIVT